MGQYLQAPPLPPLVLPVIDTPTISPPVCPDTRWNGLAIRRQAPQPTEVFDTYWRFAAKRQEIFLRRWRGEAGPWTTDPILREYKFTNPYRAADRTSQYLIRHVIYRDDLPKNPEDVIFRILLFKIFNKIDTWKHLEHMLGEITYSGFSVKLYDSILTTLSARNTIYNGAYIMPSGGTSFGHVRKHRNHLALLEDMMRKGLPQALQQAPTMEAAFYLIRDYPTIGDFLAYQYITDINYSEVVDFDEMEFVIPGPGARSGIQKCFTNADKWTGAELICRTADYQEAEFEGRGLNFETLWGRPLQLIDCQNLYCEVDKYARVKHPDTAGVGGRTRIKQKYTPLAAPLEYFFPPKWGLNDQASRLSSSPHQSNDDSQ